jgi:amino acid transporter
MIQRVQSLYLLVAILLNGVLSFYLPLWLTSENVEIFALSQPVAISLFLLSVLISFITLFSFKKRKRQFVLGRINIILNFVLVGVFAYWTLSLPGEMDISEKGIGMLLPIISIVFIALANKAIKKDEDLVKSVDRLR